MIPCLTLFCLPLGHPLPFDQEWRMLTQGLVIMLSFNAVTYFLVFLILIVNLSWFLMPTVTISPFCFIVTAFHWQGLESPGNFYLIEVEDSFKHDIWIFQTAKYEIWGHNLWRKEEVCGFFSISMCPHYLALFIT